MVGNSHCFAKRQCSIFHSVEMLGRSIIGAKIEVVTVLPSHSKLILCVDVDERHKAHKQFAGKGGKRNGKNGRLPA